MVGVYEFTHLFSNALVPIFIVPGLVLCIVLAMPFLASRAIGQVFNVVFTLGLLVALAALSYHSLAKDRADAAQQNAIAVEQWQAQRVRELARHEGIPPTGALTLLRKDPKAEGRRLFTQYCASCHDHGTSDGLVAQGEDLWIEQSTAPNLAGFASRPWLKGLLDPKQIVGPHYFGNTKLCRSKMVDWVKANLAELDSAEKTDLEKVIMAVSAEAQLPAQRDADAKDAKAIEEGRKLILGGTSLFTCTDCHKLREKGTQGDAPNLTGYGSPEWIAGVIRNPASPRFYGKLNDRMPAYAASADPAQNTLSARQIELLTDWLRGQWYEEISGVEGD